MLVEHALSSHLSLCLAVSLSRCFYVSLLRWVSGSLCRCRSVSRSLGHAVAVSLCVWCARGVRACVLLRSVSGRAVRGCESALGLQVAIRMNLGGIPYAILFLGISFLFRTQYVYFHITTPPQKLGSNGLLLYYERMM
mgnify:CR=1 FL=1